MAEMVKRLRWLFLVSVFLVLTSCGKMTQSNHTLTVTLVFNPNIVRQGQTIHGFLVVNNPGPPIDMERDEVGFRCVPLFDVGLSGNGIPRQGSTFPLDCQATPYSIRHGVTRLPTYVSASYSTCTENPSDASLSRPNCNGNRLPALPPGTFMASVLWSTKVPLPAPPPVPIVVTH